MTRKRWLAVALVAAWSLVLVGLAVWSWRDGPETVREHSELAAGRQTLDQAVDTLRTQAGPGVSVEVGDYDVTTDCRITFARRGTALDQVVTVAVAPGEEPRLLERLTQRVPEDWGARFNPVSERFTADAGDFVRVVGEPDGPGEVRFTLATGCRPGADPELVQ